jgi:hypothetical protein
MMIIHPALFLSARSEPEIIVELRESLRQWYPEWLLQLPEKFRSGDIQDAKGIAAKSAAFTATLIASDNSNRELKSLEQLFWRATCLIRTAQSNGIPSAKERPVISEVTASEGFRARRNTNAKI